MMDKQAKIDEIVKILKHSFLDGMFWDYEDVASQILTAQEGESDNLIVLKTDGTADIKLTFNQIAKRNALAYINSEPLNEEPTFAKYFKWLDKDGE